MGKVNKLINNGGTAWLRLAIYVAVTLVTVSVIYGRSDQKIAANTEQISRNTIRQERYQEKYLDIVTNINTRLSRIEGALGVKRE